MISTKVSACKQNAGREALTGPPAVLHCPLLGSWAGGTEVPGDVPCAVSLALAPALAVGGQALDCRLPDCAGHLQQGLLAAAALLAGVGGLPCWGVRALL